MTIFVVVVVVVVDAVVVRKPNAEIKLIFTGVCIALAEPKLLDRVVHERENPHWWRHGC